jgi:hypothetical protein
MGHIILNPGGLHVKNHHFGRLDKRGGALAYFEAHFPGSVCGDDRGDVLLTDGQGYLREESTEFDGDNSADQLIAAGNLSEIATPKLNVSAFQGFGNQAINFGFRDAMVSPRSFGRFQFAIVNPLFEGGVADAEDIGCFTRGKKSLHVGTPKNSLYD